MSYTPFSAPLLGGLYGDRESGACFTIDANLDAIMRFEIALVQAQTGVISAEAADAIEAKLKTFEPDKYALAFAVTVDGLAVPQLVRQMCDYVG